MNTAARLLAVSALSIFSTLGAHASQGEALAPEATPASVSTASPAEVKAGALTPVRITNGGTGFTGVASSVATRQAVRAQTEMAVRAGQIPHGEASVM